MKSQGRDDRLSSGPCCCECLSESAKEQMSQSQMSSELTVDYLRTSMNVVLKIDDVQVTSKSTNKVRPSWVSNDLRQQTTWKVPEMVHVYQVVQSVM